MVVILGLSGDGLGAVPKFSWGGPGGIPGVFLDCPEVALLVPPVQRYPLPNPAETRLFLQGDAGFLEGSLGETIRGALGILWWEQLVRLTKTKYEPI